MTISLDDAKRIIRDALIESQTPQGQGESHADHVCACPSCLCDVMDKLNKTSEYACEHCGFPLGDRVMLDKLKSCPNCGRKEPRKVR